VSQETSTEGASTQLGPLSGIRIVELAGIGPGPFAAMMLADAGAEIIRVDRAAGQLSTRALGNARLDLMNRNRRSVAVDLKKDEGVELVLSLVERADGLIEGYRPGVAERLGVGPEVALARNPRLVYGRMTGWGQEGPLAKAAGHDIDYIALSGALSMIGRKGEAPVPPLNLVGDFGGGGMLLAFGMVCALLEASKSGKGQVVDAAMVDGAAVLTTMMHGMAAMGLWSEQRGTNILDTGAHFYEVYETADHRYMAVGAIEPQFYQELLERVGLSGEELPAEMDRASWPAMKQRLAEVFRQKTRDEWCAILEGSDACAAPVLGFREAPEHPHNKARATFVNFDGQLQPAPAPRFSRTPCAIRRPAPAPGEHTREALTDWGIDSHTVEKLLESRALLEAAVQE